MPDIPPDPKHYAYRGFSPDTPAEEAASLFVERYGVPPAYIFDCPNILFAGPIPEPTEGQHA